MSTPTRGDGAGDVDDDEAERLVQRLDEPSAHLAPEPPAGSGATSSERAAARAVRDLSDPERLDGSQGST